MAITLDMGTLMFLPINKQMKKKFEVVYGDYGLQISASGIKIKKTGTGWTSL